MTARQTAEDIILAPVTRTRGTFSESVPAAEFRAALTGLRGLHLATNGLAGIAGRVAFDCELMEARQFGAHSVLIARRAGNRPGGTSLVHHWQQYVTTRAL
jgi:hypothetical protein